MPENHFISHRKKEQSALAIFLKVDLVKVKFKRCIYTYNFRFPSSHCEAIVLCSIGFLLSQFTRIAAFTATSPSTKKNKRDFPEITWPFSFREWTFFGTSLLQLNQNSDGLFSDNKRPCKLPLNTTLEIFALEHTKLLFCWWMTP